MPTPAEKAHRYGKEHKALRAHWKRRIDAGEVVECWRCGDPIDKHTPWDLGHNEDATITHGPEHRHRTDLCPGNRGEGATRGNRARGNPPPPGTPSRTW